MYRKQSGMTMIGFIFLASIVGLIVYAGIRLTPVYLEHLKNKKILEGVKEEFEGQVMSIEQMRRSIRARIDVESVSALRYDEFKIKKQGYGYSVQAAYKHEAPYIANVSLLVTFDNTVEIRR